MSSRLFKRPPKIPGPVRPRHEPPTAEEAVAAARGLTADLDQQAAIVAGLTGLAEAEARAQVLSVPPERPARVTLQRDSEPWGAPARPVVVERRRVPMRAGEAAPRDWSPRIRLPR